MPRTNLAQKQKNKPFKGKSKGKQEKGKVKASTKTKHIAKVAGRVKNGKPKIVKNAKSMRLNQVNKMAEKNEYLDSSTKEIVMRKMKNQSESKIIVLIPGSKDANTDVILSRIYSELENFSGISMCADFKGLPFNAMTLTPIAKNFMQNKLMIVSAELKSKDMSSERNFEALNDLMKCADIICPVLSCRSTNTKAMRQNPHDEGGAFDETGYTILNMIRSMGSPAIVGIVQDLELHDKSQHDKIERLFKRFISSELGEEDKISYLKGNQNQIQKLIRQMDTTPTVRQAWKKDRAFMLVENVRFEEDPSLVTFQGYLKGNCIHANQLCHVTGFDDFQIEKIQIRSARQTVEIPPQFATNPESMFPFSKAEEYSDDLLSALNGLKIEQKNNKEEMGDDEDFMDEESENDEDPDEYFGNAEENAHHKQIQMQKRSTDELEFEDQVEYAAEEVLREKFKEFQALKNFKTSDWNHLENLPDEYDRIYTFKHYNRTKVNAIAENQTKGFAYPGFYVSVTLKNFPAQNLEAHSSQYPIILTFLLKHERKMTQLHLKVRRNPYYPLNDTVIESNQNYFISMGFRRIVVRPIFSQIIQGTEKTKYIKNIKEDYESYFLCSFYYYNYFPPATAQIHRVNQVNLAEKQSSPILYGELVKCDPMHIILERIILTGYPFKIYKKRSVVRFMFFNAGDVKYFKPVEVRTKFGLKGKIEESRGTHGYMKVLFSDKIKHNDTVCMYLYRRVFPQPAF